jgi:hypothetical protein
LRGTFTNSSILEIGTVSNSGYAGIINSGAFDNTGIISVDKVTTTGIISGLTFSNNQCGRIIVKSGKFEVRPTHTFTNTGFTYVASELLNNGTFKNEGTLKYGTYSGNTINNNTNSSVIIKDDPESIFTYGGTYDGVVNGIFTDSLNSNSAGTFTTPNTFVPDNSLPIGSQTLYAKVTPIGGACSFSVPFDYEKAAPPVITVQPVDKTVCPATSTSLSVTTTFATSYQWQVKSGTTDFTDLTDAGVYSNVNSTTLLISNSTELSGNQYRCVATSAAGSATSTTVTLNVIQPNLTLTAPINNILGNAGTFKSNDTIIATSLISGSATVTFETGKSILLNLGFFAAAGSVFLTKITQSICP